MSDLRAAVRELVRRVTILEDNVTRESTFEVPISANVPHTILDAATHTDSALFVVIEGALALGNNTPLWDGLPPPGAAGYALVSTAPTLVWDQTPSWTGEHSFVDGIAFTGASDANEITIPDNTAIAFELEDAGGLEYLRIVSLNAQPIIDFNNAAADIDFHVQANGVVDAFQVRGADGQITLGALTAGVVQSNAGGVLSSGAVPLADLAGYAQGSIIRGGAADWEAHAAETDGAILIGDGADVASTITPSIAGLVTLRAGALIQDDQTLIFGTGSDGTIEYDENGTDQVRVAGATWIYEPVVSFNAGIAFTGASDANNITIPDDLDIAVEIVDTGGTEYLRIVTSEQPAIVFNEGSEDIDFRWESNVHTHALFGDAGTGAVGIRSAAPGIVAGGLYVPWIAADAVPTAYFGSQNVANARNAIDADTHSGTGVAGRTSSGTGILGFAVAAGVGGHFYSTTGIGAIVNLTGAGTAILAVQDNGAAVWTFEDGGNLLCGATGTLDLNGVADALILSAAGTTSISDPTGGQIDFEILGADDFTMTANAFNVLAGSDIVMGEATSIGIGPAAERVEFYGAGFVSVMGANFGVGTATSESLLHAQAASGSIHLIEATNGFAMMQFRSYRATAATHGLFNAESARGTKAVPAIIQNGDEVFRFIGTAYDATDFNNQAASMRIVIDGAVAANQIPGKWIFSTNDGSGPTAIDRMTILANGNVGIATATPGQIFDVNQGSGNMIADGYDTHSLELWKENLTPVTGEGMIDKLKSFDLFEWTRTPFVSTTEVVALAVEHFGLGDVGDARSYYDSLALDNPIRIWIDEKRKQLQDERADLPEWTRKHTGLVADDPNTLAALGDVIGYDDKGTPTGYSLGSHVGFLHAVILDLVAEVEALKAAALH